MRESRSPPSSCAGSVPKGSGPAFFVWGYEIFRSLGYEVLRFLGYEVFRFLGHKAFRVLKVIKVLRS